MRSRQSRGPWAGTVGAMRRPGREATGALRGNSSGGPSWGPGRPRHVPPSHGGSGPHPLTCLPGARARHHLGEPLAQRPHSSPGALGHPPGVLTTTLPPPPDLGCCPGPSFQFPARSLPWPTIPTSVWPVSPSADARARGLLLPWANTPQPWSAPTPHPAQVPLGLLFHAHTHTHARTRALILPWPCSPGPQHSPEALSPYSHTC